MKLVNEWFESKSGYGAVFIRLVAGAYLVYLQLPNVFSPENMVIVGNFLMKKESPSLQ